MVDRIVKSFLVGIVLVALGQSPLFAGLVFIPLGDLPGAFGTTDFYSIAYGVSNDGSTVVGTSASGAHGYEAFRWTAGEGMVGLGFGGTGMDASADGGVIVGHSGSEAFRWTSGTGKVGLGDLPGGTVWSSAAGVSADGTVIVGESVSDNGEEAFRWTEAGGMIGLGDLPNGVFSSEAHGVSDDGNLVVGIGTKGGNFFEGFKWTNDSGMVGIGVMPGGTETVAHAVNDAGDVVGAGKSGGAISLSPPQAFLNLGSLGDFAVGGSLFTYANDLSADADIVVGYGRLYGDGEAFLWTSTFGMQPIRDLLIAHGNDMTGWDLKEATAISSNGNYIVGYGTNPDGKTEAWLISDIQSVPEPSSFVLLIGLSAGLAGFTAYRRRRRAA
ncbi:MAG: PEP-CTERM sorting domain-containing protein [Planctomycetaceae bacterium]